MRSRRGLVLAPRASATFPGVEFSVHQAWKSLRDSDVAVAFPAVRELPDDQPVFVVVTCQRNQTAESALAGPVTAAAAEFKDLCRENVFAFFDALRTVLPAGSFVDCADPATGLPVRSAASSSTWVETDAIEQLLSYELVLVAGSGGGCRLISHPRWGVDVYPASGVVSCVGGEEELLAVLRDF